MKILTMVPDFQISMNVCCTDLVRTVPRATTVLDPIPAVVLQDGQEKIVIQVIKRSSQRMGLFLLFQRAIAGLFLSSYHAGSGAASVNCL